MNTNNNNDNNDNNSNNNNNNNDNNHIVTILQIDGQDFYMYRHLTSSVIRKSNYIKITFNTQTHQYLLVTDNSAVIFDKIIAYYNNINYEHDTPTLILIKSKQIIYFKLDDIFKDSTQLFQEFDKIIIQSNLNYNSDQITIQQHIDNEKIANYEIIHYTLQNKLLFKFTTGTFIANNINTFYHNYDTLDATPYTTIIPFYDNILFHFQLDKRYTFQQTFIQTLLHHIKNIHSA